MQLFAVLHPHRRAMSYMRRLQTYLQFQFSAFECGRIKFERTNFPLPRSAALQYARQYPQISKNPVLSTVHYRRL